MATEQEQDYEELLTAFLDGVAELTPDERRRVEQRLASDPALRRDADEIRSLLERARKLPSIAPSIANEPDWSALERQIREAVGDTVPLPWWRRARWIAPIGALVTTAAIALLWLHHAPITSATSHDAGASALAITTAVPAAHAAEPASPAKPAPTTATSTIYIDGQVIDISNVDPEALMDDGDGDDTAATDNAVLPAADYNWIDRLDDKAMERAERWLARKKG